MKKELISREVYVCEGCGVDYYNQESAILCELYHEKQKCGHPHKELGFCYYKIDLICSDCGKEIEEYPLDNIEWTQEDIQNILNLRSRYIDGKKR